MEHQWNATPVVVSILIAILHSYVAFDLASRIVVAKRRRARVLLITLGGMTLGFGIWSMHFVGMFAMEMPGVDVSYAVGLVIASFAIAAVNAALSLYLYTRPSRNGRVRLLGSASMTVAIVGMHYVAMYSMRMPGRILWSRTLVVASVLIAFVASLRALALSNALNRGYAQRLDHPAHEFDERGPLIRGGVYMGLAIAGMHYTGMAAATFVPSAALHAPIAGVLSTPALSTAVVIFSMLTLGISIASGHVDRKLARSAARLRKEQELRSQFVSAVVHDLRNPLSAAMLSVQLMRSKLSEQDALRRTSSTALDNLKRMDQLIQSLLDAQRISTGQPLPIHLQHLELGALLRQTVESLSNIYGKRFELECGRTLEGEWDAGFLRRAVENLCANAVKYGARDAPIKVSAIPDPDAEQVSVQVQNQGDPLTPEERRGLFDLFTRGPKAEESTQTGWGLGLSIVKGVAEAHGGSVQVESNRERGTVFTMRLPLHAHPA